MSVRRFAISIFPALITFSVGAAITFYFLPNQVAVPQEAQTSQLKANGFAFDNSQPSKLSEIPKTQTSPLKERKFPEVRDTKTTVAGKLEIIETDFLEWKVVLDGKQIFAIGDYSPQIAAQISGKTVPFDEVIVLMQMSGTCCEFGRFWFLGLKSDGSYYFSKPIGNGFAYMPEVSRGENYIKVRVRGGRENHGEFYMPGGAWIFQNGRVRKIK